ncbi:MAG: ROK family protein [Acholeplasmataceae bacterium]|nr:ROK family protein [Acholeplasmataceae bacterium]
MNYIFGIDVGGTNIKIGLFTENGELIEKNSIKTNKLNDGAYIIGDIASFCLSLLEEKGINKNEVLGFGFGVPGPVSNNIVIQAPNIGWKNLDLSKEFQKEIGFKTIIELANDATIAALGEYKEMGLKENIVFITLGTGVGGGIILDSKALEGAHGAGGEIGHIKVEYNHPIKCSCGLYGCLETVASISGITRIAQELIEEGKFETKLNRNHLNPKTIFDAAKNGDRLGNEVLNNVSDYIGRACASIAVTVDPAVFIIGGGISNAGDTLINAIEKAYQNYSHYGTIKTTFRLAKLGNDAGMYGSAELIRGQLQ